MSMTERENEKIPEDKTRCFFSVFKSLLPISFCFWFDHKIIPSIFTLYLFIYVYICFIKTPSNHNHVHVTQKKERENEWKIRRIFALFYMNSIN